MSDDELETRIEYGRMIEGVGWVREPLGIKYAQQQRTVHFRVDEPVPIDHWTYADHRHPVEGCGYCESLAAEGREPLTTKAAVEQRLGPTDDERPAKDKR